VTDGLELRDGALGERHRSLRFSRNPGVEAGADEGANQRVVIETRDQPIVVDAFENGRGLFEMRLPAT